MRLGSGQVQDLHPDGTRIVSSDVGESGVLNIYPTGSGDTIRVDIPDMAVGTAAFTGRGNEMLIVGRYHDAPAQAFLYDPADGEPKPVTPQGVEFFAAMLNPTQRLVAVAIRGEPALAYPLDGGPPQALPGMQPNHFPSGWSDDGRFLYLAERDTIPLTVVRYDRERRVTEPFLELMPPSPAGLIDIGPVFVAPSGSAYLYSYRSYLSTLYLGEGLDPSEPAS